MQKLGYMNLGKWKNSGFYFGHILDNNNVLHLTPEQIAFITIRDPRGFFLSLCNFCDVKCKEIMKGADVDHGMDAERAPLWSTMTFEEKLESLVFQNDKSIFDVKGINSIFQTACDLMAMGVPAIKFEDIASLNSFSEPSEISIETCIKAISYLGISLKEDDASEILRLSWGNSITFDPEGGPDKWKKNLPDDIKRNIELKYNSYINQLGYEI